MRSRGKVFECEQVQELVDHQEVRYCYMELIGEHYPTSSLPTPPSDRPCMSTTLETSSCKTAVLVHPSR